jgi:hypothetical protein
VIDVIKDKEKKARCQVPSDDILYYLKRKLSCAPFMAELYENKATGERYTKVFPILAVRGTQFMLKGRRPGGRGLFRTWI